MNTQPEEHVQYDTLDKTLASILFVGGCFSFLLLVLLLTILDMAVV